MKQLPAVLYISTFVNDETYSHLNDKAKSNFSFSANKYSSLIRRGLETKMGSKLSCIFSPAIGDCSVTGIKYFRPIVTDASPDGVYLGCLNVAILKQIVISLKIFHYSLKWYLGNFSASHKVVVLSSIQLPFFLGILLLKLFGVKVVQFVPDLPSFQYEYSPLQSKVKRLILPLYKRVCSAFYRMISFYVFITQQTAPKFPSRPFTIMEGLVERQGDYVPLQKEGKFTILYAGLLAESMGIKTLLDAMRHIRNKDIRLELYGNGDLLSLIAQRAQEDDRIIYGGCVPNEYIVNRQKQVHLLINPRITANEFTKYSFPSKLMEYMLSGTPVLTTKLAGIPDCYADKMFYIEDETPTGMADAIANIMSSSTGQLNEFGLKARDYVVANKTFDVQLSRIVDNFNDRLFYEKNSSSN